MPKDKWLKNQFFWSFHRWELCSYTWWKKNVKFFYNNLGVLRFLKYLLKHFIGYNDNDVIRPLSIIIREIERAFLNEKKKKPEKVFISQQETAFLS